MGNIANLCSEEARERAKELREETKQSKAIYQQLEDDYIRSRKELEIAFAGREGAGKKTIIRQLRKYFDHDWEDKHAEGHIQTLHANIIEDAKELVDGVRRLHAHQMEQKRLKAEAEKEAKEREEKEQQILQFKADDESDSDLTEEEDEDDDDPAKADADAAAAEAAASEGKLSEPAKKFGDDADDDDEDDEDDDDDDDDDATDEEAGSAGSEDEAEKEVPVHERDVDIDKLENLFSVIESYDEDEDINPEHAEDFEELWASWEVQEAYRLRGLLKMRLKTPIKYFLSRIREVLTKEYIPPHDALVSMCFSVSPIVHTVATLDHVKYTCVDVSTQKNKIEKWLSTQDKISSFVFVVATDRYDQQLPDDYTLNEITESSQLFQRFMDEPALRRRETVKYLWFNRFHEFSQKLRQVSLKDPKTKRFMDYDGGMCTCEGITADLGRCTCDAQRIALNYITEKFLSKIPQIRSQIRIATCNACDYYSFKTCFTTTKEVVLKKHVYKLTYVS